MANQFTYQVLRDTNQKAVIKLTGFFDGASGDESNVSRISANTLYGALDANNVPLRSGLSKSNTAQSYYGLAIEKICAPFLHPRSRSFFYSPTRFYVGIQSAY